MQPIGDVLAPTVWEGRKVTLTGAATGGRLPAARYRVTPQHLYWTTGRLGRKAQSVPLWAVRDVSLAQSVAQIARRVGTLTVSLQHPHYTGTPTFVLLEDIEHPKQVARRITDAARASRLAHDA